MVIKRTLSPWQVLELRDHKNNTAGELIKVYTPAQLSFLDWVDDRTIKTSKKYLPVRVDSWPAVSRFRRGEQEKMYRIMYIRLDEVRALYNKRTGNKLVIEIQ